MNRNRSFVKNNKYPSKHDNYDDVIEQQQQARFQKVSNSRNNHEELIKYLRDGIFLYQFDRNTTESIIYKWFQNPKDSKTLALKIHWVDGESCIIMVGSEHDRENALVLLSKVVSNHRNNNSSSNQIFRFQKFEPTLVSDFKLRKMLNKLDVKLTMETQPEQNPKLSFPLQFEPTKITEWSKNAEEASQKFPDQNPDIFLEKIELDSTRSVTVVRDDLLTCGTKQRALFVLLNSHHSSLEFVYATPNCGYAQYALANAAKITGKKATVFVAQQKERHNLTTKAEELGAKICEVSDGLFVKVQLEATQYVQQQKEKGEKTELIPFGLMSLEFIWILQFQITKAFSKLTLDNNNTTTTTTNSLKNDNNNVIDLNTIDLSSTPPPSSLISIEHHPKRLWLVCGSGTVLSALRNIWPKTHFLIVQVGHEIDEKILNGLEKTVYIASEKFTQPAIENPPYPSNENYDAKLWKFVKEHGQDGDCIWNVAR